MGRDLVATGRIAFLLSALAWTLVGLLLPPCPGFGAETPTTRQTGQALDRLDEWLGEGANGDRWRVYFHADELRRELSRGDEADPAVLMRSLVRLRSGAKGLELSKFASFRAQLSSLVAELVKQRQTDLATLAEASCGDLDPVSEERFAAVRTELSERAEALQAALGRGSAFADEWNRYLHWDKLAPSLSPESEIDARATRDLEEVLSKLRANQPGLELPVFVELAKAIEQCRSLAPWAAAERSRDTREDYVRLMAAFERQLRRHAKAATTETSWQVGRILGVVEAIGDSPLLASAVRRRYVQPNIYAVGSARLIGRIPTEPVNNRQPVTDCILGTSIYGTANTLGAVRLAPLDAADRVELAVYFSGQTYSSTKGYNKPVRIRSSGVTSFSAAKRVAIADAGFSTGPSSAAAATSTKIKSINKTGGQFGHKLVEKIAWKRAGQQKRQAEQIASRHAEQRIASGFDEQLQATLAEARKNYETKFRAPLVRRDVFPDPFHLSSTTQGVRIQAGLGRAGQIGASGPPPGMRVDEDATLQIHESAVNNYLPLAFAGATISQESEDQPPKIKGNVPAWVRRLSDRPAKRAAAALPSTSPAEVESGPQLQPAAGDAKLAERKAPPFKPWSMTLHPEAPIAVRFDDDKLIVRIRTTELASDGDPLKDWDFIVAYQVIQDGDGILLRRVGEIEVFPSGFDPRHDTRMPSQKSGLRNTLAKNMNARAAAGQSFPPEISIDPVVLEKLGPLRLRELVADDGWLSLGWTLP